MSMKSKKADGRAPEKRAALTGCPECGSNWEYKVKRKKYSRLIGIEDPNIYDGVSWWRCPDCGATWDRWTGKLERKGKRVADDDRALKKWAEASRKARNRWFRENS